MPPFGPRCVGAWDSRGQAYRLLGTRGSTRGQAFVATRAAAPYAATASGFPAVARYAWSAAPHRFFSAEPLAYQACSPGRAPPSRTLSTRMTRHCLGVASGVG